jgi:DNA polymerase
MALRELREAVKVCKDCPLFKTRTNAVPGEGGGEVMIIGEAPGRSEDKTGRPFAGAAGLILNEMLAIAGLGRTGMLSIDSVGVIRARPVYITNVVKCRPPGNRVPTQSEVSMCSQYLTKEIEIINPKLIILLGDTALKRFFPSASVTHIHGRFIETHLHGNFARSKYLFFVSFHPAYILHGELNLRKSMMAKDFALLGEKINEILGY